MEALDYALLDRAGARSYFFPRADHSPPAEGARDTAIEVAEGIDVAARIYLFDPVLPTALYFHGDGEVAATYDAIAPLYRAIGLNLVVAEFRGYGRSGGEPSFVGMIDDAAPIARRFHELLDAEGCNTRRFIMGRSLGAYPALEIAARHASGFCALVIESGGVDLDRANDYFGISDFEPAMRLAAGHAARIQSVRLPTLLIHGARDHIVPLEEARWLEAQLRGGAAECELLVIPDAGHNDLLTLGAESYFAAIRRMVEVTATQPAAT